MASEGPSRRQLDEECGSVVDEPPQPGLGSLPEELLERILALLPLTWRCVEDNKQLGVPALLRLRLVCRRWARSVLSPAVLRHRKLNAFTQPYVLSLLRLVPVIDQFEQGCRGDVEGQTVVLRGLANSTCKIRSLCFFTWAHPQTCALAARILEQRRSSLQELNLELNDHHDLPHSSCHFDSLLAALDAMEGLTKLTLGGLGNWLFDKVFLEFEFRQLSTLRCLVLRDGLHHSTIRSLLAANKLSLREVDCGHNPVIKLIQEEVLSVRMVRVGGGRIDENLVLLRHLPDLELLDVEQGWSRAGLLPLARLLECSPLVPRRVQLRLYHLQLFTWDASLSRQMHRLTIVLVRIEDLSSRPHQPLSLPHVEMLHIDLLNACNKPAWKDLQAAFVESTAPKLRELHVHHSKRVTNHACQIDTWLAQMRAQRPHLKICSRNLEECPGPLG